MPPRPVIFFSLLMALLLGDVWRAEPLHRVISEAKEAATSCLRLLCKDFRTNCNYLCPRSAKLGSEDSRIEFFYAIALALTLKLKG
jgi:hypothetical protein